MADAGETSPAQAASPRSAVLLVAAGLVLGLVGGAVAGLLRAPRPGGRG